MVDSSGTTEGIMAKALRQSHFRELSNDVKVKRWPPLPTGRGKFKALWAGGHEGQSRRPEGLGLRETKALSSTVPKPGDNVLLCTVICLNNLMKHRGTR